VRSSAAVEAVAGVTNVICDGPRITIAAAAPARILSHIIEAIAGTGLDIRSVEILDQNLESVFLDLTGRRLRE
jgi:hypothetical protein